MMTDFPNDKMPHGHFNQQVAFLVAAFLSISSSALLLEYAEASRASSLALTFLAECECETSLLVAVADSGLRSCL